MLALLVCSTALSAVAVEVGFRLTGPWIQMPLRGLYRPNPDGSHRLAPDFSGRVVNPEFAYTVRTNALGLREREIPPKRNGEKRILVLGDSFAFGSGVEPEQTFERLLERRVTAASPKETVLVLNAGVEGYGTTEALRLLESLGRGLEPDLVLLGFYLGNDFSDNRPPGVAAKPGVAASPDVAASPSRRQAADEWLRGQLQSFAWARQRSYILLARFGLRSPYLGDLGMIARLAGDDPSAIASLQWSADLIEAVARASGRLGAPFGVFLIPARGQVYREEAASVWAYYGLVPSEQVVTAGNRLLMETLALRGISSFDLLPALRSASSGGERLYFRVDVHWTPAGHEVVAGALDGFLRDSTVLTAPVMAPADSPPVARLSVPDPRSP